MPTHQQTIKDVLRSKVVPALRELGFRGTFPHFYRLRAEQLDLVGFQFHRHRDAFAVNVASTLATEHKNRYGETIPPEGARAAQIDFRRVLRLGQQPTPPPIQDHWFDFSVDDSSTHDATADTVVALLQSQAEHFLRTHEVTTPKSA